MNMKKTVFLIGLFGLISVGSVFSQTDYASKGTKDATQLRIKADEVFRNDSPGFSITLPEKWLKSSTKKAVEITKKARKTDKKLTNTAKRQFDNSIANTAFLFSISREPVGSIGNASFSSVVEKLPKSDRFTTRQIVLSSQQNLARNFGRQVVSPIKRVVLGGRSFYLTSLRKTINGFDVWQKIYFLKLGNSRVLQFGLTYLYEEDLVTMEKALNTLQFSK